MAEGQETIAAALVGGGFGNAHVLRAKVVEAVDEPTAATVRLATHEEIDLEAPIGAEVTLEVSLDDEVLRRFHLVVCQVAFERVVATKEGKAPLLVYEVELEHPMAMLRLRRDVRMFQERDATAIVQDVLSRAPVAFDASFAVQRTLRTRDVCVQYRETDFDFVSRLCEAEGVFYLCDDDGDAAKVVFSDATSAFSPIDEADAIPLRDTGHFGGGVWDLWSEIVAVPDQVTVVDYDFEKPNLAIEASAPIADTVVSDWLDFPGGAPDPGEAQALATIRAEGFAGRKSQAEGHGDRLSFRAGRTFELDDGASTRWLITRVEHTIAPRPEDGSEDAPYRNRFVARPKEAAYRPERRAPTPVARGAQSVIVTGPPGEEIHTDDLGRLKARFFWDRQAQDDDKSSFWLRMAQLPISGSMALARVGWELAVVHLHGDPDQPVAVARLYNAEKVSPYGYPGAGAQMALQTPTSPGGGKSNELRMTDSGGTQEVFLNASKDYDGATKNNKTETIGADETLKVGACSKVEVKTDQTYSVGGNLTMTVGADTGTLVKADRTRSVGGSETATIVGNVTAIVTGSDTETTGGTHTTLAVSGIERTSVGSQSLTVGGSMISAAAAEVSMAVAGAKSESIGGVKICAAGDSVDTKCVGAMAITVGGVCVQAAGGNFSGGAKNVAITVGGAVLANAAGKVAISSKKVSITVAGVANFLGGGGVLNLTAGSASLTALVKLDASGAIKIKGTPNIVG